MMWKTVVRFSLCASMMLTLIPILPEPLPVSASAADSIAGAALVAVRLTNGGYRVRTDSTNTLREGYYRDYSVTLYRGNHYVIFACGDEDARDIDIYLYDKNGRLIDRDRLVDAQPVVEVSPRWSGRYTIRVKMYESYRARSAYYTVAVMYR